MVSGCCVWFTGLPCAGKSTLAQHIARSLESSGLEVVLLDGDAVRQSVSADLGFSRRDRDANVARIARLAAEVVGRGGIAICALVSPYREARASAREIVSSANFIEVFVDTPLEVCEARDVKGMYKLARAGVLDHFTGVSDPYEPPLNPEIHVVGAGDPADVIRPVLEAIQRRNGAVAS